MVKNKLEIIKNMGIGWTMFRVKYELEKKLGLIEKKFKPVTLTNEQFVSKLNLKGVSTVEELHFFVRKNTLPFFFTNQEINVFKRELEHIRGNINYEVLYIADQICVNEFTYFSKQNVAFENIDWHLNPIIYKKSPNNKHWVTIPDLGKEFGDIKLIWELSRFSFVYTLVRAYAVTKDDKYVRKFWELFEDWVLHNPLEIGVHYKCGQEMSLRVMAWIFALYAFLEHEETTSDRVVTMLRMIYYHIDHVEKHFDFALKSVRNNHTISEAAGMYTVGLLFPYFDKTEKWKNKGKKYLEQEGLNQIYEDGSYLQHSMNYQRLVVQDYTWVLQLAKLNNDIFSEKLIDRVKDCVMFLYNNQDQTTGRLPNYGMNDGALIHPLACNDYLDYRPQLQAAWYVLTETRLYKEGLHDENLLWICGINALQTQSESIKKETKAYPIGGYYTIHSSKSDSFGMIRCATYKDRPHQADMLHFDLWWNGYNILADAGTFSYNTEQNWQTYFNGTASHNTLMINDKDQMTKASRFIWLNWTKSRNIQFHKSDEFAIFEGEHYGYNPLVHRRAVLNYLDSWIIVDDLIGDFNGESKKASLNWLFGINDFIKIDNGSWKVNVGNQSLDFKVILSPVYKDVIFNGSEKPVKGWRSLYYGAKKPSPQLQLKFQTNKPVRFITVVSQESKSISYDDKQMVIKVEGTEFPLQQIGQANIFKLKGVLNQK